MITDYPDQVKLQNDINQLTDPFITSDLKFSLS